MPRRILQGTVTSDKNEQTVTVIVERRITHPVLKKTIRMSKKYRHMMRITRSRLVILFAFRNAHQFRNPNAGRS